MAKKTHIASPTGPSSRPPVVTVVGHIDHGKSTLLDYIRKSNVTEGEAGGITQHLSAYEATHTNATGEHRITFLDTPGHEAFRAMRSRGLGVADVAIVIVSAEEGAKPQTVEALALVAEAQIPYIVAFTKIDKPGANLEKAKMSLLENQIFLEGMGGDVPWVAISSKTGEGIPELLDLILLAAELEELVADASLPASGAVIEAHVDPKRGNTATLMVQNGTIQSGTFVVAGGATAPVRIMENFLGKPIKEAGPSSPVRIVGFSTLPAVGEQWRSVENKKDAEAQSAEVRAEQAAPQSKTPSAEGESSPEENSARLVVPILIKTDVAGTGEAVVHEMQKLPQNDRLEARVVAQSVGAISESDVKLVGSGKTPGIIIGFNVKVEKEARDVADRLGVMIETFEVIYKLSDWLAQELEVRRPRKETDDVVGAAKVLKFFSSVKDRVVIGGRVEEGSLKTNAEIKIMRRDEEVGRGKVLSLQSQKREVKEVEAGTEFGAMLKCTVEPAPGDRIEAYKVILA